ncbi:MAG TPA: twin-arginine translocase TatA/TatE family subunit [Chitinophagales bacterium]|nr:twin-arginine translocase TatA/TatE family subunit [Chitinophagales bacterium]
MITTDCILLWGMPGWGEWLLIIVVALLFFFGGKKIPELMRGIGSGIRELKNAGKEETDT